MVRRETSRRKERDFRTLLLAVTLEPREIGRRIAAARKRHGWTQLDFAYKADVSPSAVQRWERGELPRIKKLMQVAELLGVQVDQLVENGALPSPAEERYQQIEAQLAELRGTVARLLQEDAPRSHEAEQDPAR